MKQQKGGTSAFFFGHVLETMRKIIKGGSDFVCPAREFKRASSKRTADCDIVCGAAFIFVVSAARHAANNRGASRPPHVHNIQLVRELIVEDTPGTHGE